MDRNLAIIGCLKSKNGLSSVTNQKSVLKREKSASEKQALASHSVYARYPALQVGLRNAGPKTFAEV
jgi:hypothetical protein